MGRDLECPGTFSSPDWASLYRARGDEVVAHRPLFTGDVFGKVKVPGSAASISEKMVTLVQHPCALRTNGTDLTPQLIVAEVREFKVLTPKEWKGHYKKMPLPELMFSDNGETFHGAAFFDSLLMVPSENLHRAKRLACLSPVGINLMLQRWVAYNSRAVIPTVTYQEVTNGPYEEADLVEEWCEQRVSDGMSINTATSEAVEWLRKCPDENRPRRQDQLTNPQQISGIRRDMRKELSSLAKQL
jgi:hypothetical protein